MCDGHDPNAIRLLLINNAKREPLDFVTSGLRLFDVAMLRIGRYLFNGRLDCDDKLVAQKRPASLIK
jgi:hypothetical protein